MSRFKSFYAQLKDRRVIRAVLGDVAIILAVAVGAPLLAWQYWFTSFARPVLAVIRIEATDTRGDTADLAHHLAALFRGVGFR